MPPPLAASHTFSFQVPTMPSRLSLTAFISVKPFDPSAPDDIAERLVDSARDAGDDEAEAGAKAFEREHDLAASQNAQDLLDQGERALHRIDGGTYGVCESCGKPIGKARLLAFPRATLCVQCKQREERR